MVNISVVNDLVAQELTEANCITRLSHAKKLMSKFPESTANFIFFTDEKIFTVALPVNLQNDSVYAPCGTEKRDIAADRLLRTRPTFSKSVMVSVAVSKLGCTELIFVEPGVKVDLTLTRSIIRFGAVFRNACTRSPYVTWIS